MFGLRHNNHTRNGSISFKMVDWISSITPILNAGKCVFCANTLCLASKQHKANSNLFIVILVVE
jgi:hypothetical protein